MLQGSGEKIQTFQAKGTRKRCVCVCVYWVWNSRRTIFALFEQNKTIVLPEKLVLT